MTSASQGRVQRRARKHTDKATAYKPGDAPKSIITLTEIPGSNGGFTIGMGLHGARMEELTPGQAHPISIVDVLALAINHVLRTQPKDFQESVSLVNSTLQNVQAQIAGGASAEDAIGDVGGALLEDAIGDLEPADEPEPEAANVG